MDSIDQRCKRVHRSILIGAVCAVIVGAPAIMALYNTVLAKLLLQTFVNR